MTPTIHLASQSGSKTKFREDIDAFVPDKSKQNEITLGAANGTYTLEETLKSSFETSHALSKEITKIDNKISFPNVVEKNQLCMINFGVYSSKRENYKRFLIFKMMLQFLI